jgi:hypothetical protein
MTRLYLQELPAPRLYLDVPEAQTLVLKSVEAPDLYLAKAKYTRREGSPGNYRYYYDDDKGKDGPKQMSMFGESEPVATQQQVADAINKLDDRHEMDFLTMADKLEDMGVNADTSMIGDAFDSGMITGEPKGSEKPIIAAYGGKDIHGPTQDMKDFSEQMRQPRSAFGEPAPYAHYKGQLDKLVDAQVAASGGDRKYHQAAADHLRNHAYDAKDKATQETSTMLARAHEKAAGKAKKSVHLYLDIGKGNPHRDPSVGTFIGGGGGKAMGEGQEDLDAQSKELMDQMPGEDVEKAKYIRREGSPGNYKYIYEDKKGKERVSESELPKVSGMSNDAYLLQTITNYLTGKPSPHPDDVKERHVRNLPEYEGSEQ